MRPEEARGTAAGEFRIPYREGGERRFPYREEGEQQVRYREEGERRIPFRAEAYAGPTAPSFLETVTAPIGRSPLFALGIAIVVGFVIGFVLRTRIG